MNATTVVVPTITTGVDNRFVPGAAVVATDVKEAVNPLVTASKTVTPRSV